MESTYSRAQIAIIAAALRTTGGCPLLPGDYSYYRLLLESRHAAGMAQYNGCDLGELPRAVHV
jgi:hypothetical protein